MARVENHADETEYVRDGRGRPRLGIGAEQPERLHVGVEAGDLTGREVEVVHAELARLTQDVVVDVGYVADAKRLVAEVPQPPLQHVVGQVDRGVAEMGRVIGRNPAGVHRDHFARSEGDDLAPSSVVEPHQRRQVADRARGCRCAGPSA